MYRHLRDGGRTMYPVNVHASSATVIEGDRAYCRLADVPDPLDGVVVMVNLPELMGVLHEVAERGAGRVWIHRGLGQPAVARRGDRLLRRARHRGGRRRLPAHVRRARSRASTGSTDCWSGAASRRDRLRVGASRHRRPVRAAVADSRVRSC